MKRIISGGEPFFLPGGEVGCLLVHGFTGAPKEMRWLGDHLAAQGHTVLGVRLFAHATDMQDMTRARRRDWQASVEDGYHMLSGACDQVVVMGLSLGGVLALLLGAHFPVAGVVAMATPCFTPDSRMPWLRPILPIVSMVWKFAPKGPPYWKDPLAAEDHLSYPQNPVRAGVEVHDLLAQMRRSLPSVTAPVLLVYSTGDPTVSPEHAALIHRQLGASHKQIVWVENSGHVVTRDAERERVFAAAAAFVRTVTGSRK
jgi:carboxylesterase